MLRRVGDTVWVTCRGSKRTLARRALVLLAAAGCATSAPMPAGHPADAHAPIGRLVDPSPSLAAGVVTYAEPVQASAATPADHAGHTVPAGHAMPAGHVMPADHAGHAMPADHAGHAMPADHAGHAMPADHAGHTMPTDHAGHAMPTGHAGHAVPADHAGHAVPADAGHATPPDHAMPGAETKPTAAKPAEPAHHH